MGENAIFDLNRERERWKRIWHLDRKSRDLGLPLWTAPIYMRQQISALDLLTENLDAQLEGLSEQLSSVGMRSTLSGIQSDLDGWKVRLDAYAAVLAAVPEDQEEDPVAVEISILAPLFFGGYDHDPQKGFQRVALADINTPYAIANDLTRLNAWREDAFQFSQFADDLLAQAAITAQAVHDGVEKAAEYVLKYGGVGLSAVDKLLDADPNTFARSAGWAVGLVVAAGGLFLWTRRKR